MRVVLRVEVEAVKFLKEEPYRLEALLKRCSNMTDALSTLRRYTPLITISVNAWCHSTSGFADCFSNSSSSFHPPIMHRQVTEGVWKGPEDLPSQQQKRSEDRSSDLDILNSPPLSLSDLSSTSGLANWMPMSSNDSDTSGPEQDIQPSMTFRNRVLDDLPGRRPSDKSVSAEVRLVMSSINEIFLQLDSKKSGMFYF